MAEAPFDVARAHRWFAVELNNEAWDALEAGDRSPEDTERMIHAAHGACYHWLHAGDLLNHLRAQCLLTTTYAAAGHTEAALRHAAKTLSLSEQAGDDQTAWDRATTWGCAALAYRLAGRHDEAVEMQEKATEASKGFDDSGDHDVFEKLFPRV
jgi:tetratricopeptide (TPR) repeat protein